MSMIRGVLDTLQPEDREALIYAFNELMCLTIDVPTDQEINCLVGRVEKGDKVFLAVHLPDTVGMRILETNGMWYLGIYDSKIGDGYEL